ncbi:MAG: tetratricopeptide repeat-containing sulfotransferase family protein [Pseudomonadota bacterium]
MAQGDPSKDGDPHGTLAVALSHGFDLLREAPSLAAEQADEILRLFPSNAQALVLLGAARRRLGDPAAAIAALERALRFSPFSAEALLEKGLAEAAAGESRRAINSVAHALSLKSDFVNAWRALADELLRAGDEDAAGRAYAKHVTASAKDPELLEAGLALNEGRLGVAERQLKSYLMRAPTDVAAIRMLAELAARIGRYQDAENLLDRAVELAPDFRAARHNLAIVQLRQGKAAEAITQSEILLKTSPKDPSYRTLYCAGLVRIGDYDKAIRQYDELLKDHPNHPKSWMSFGHALKTVGKQAEAIAAYRRSIRMQPSLGEAYWSLANLKTVRFSDEDVQAMRDQLARDDLNEDDRLHLHFALGKALEDKGAYEESFVNYERGNALRQQQIRYFEDEVAGRMDDAKRVFTAEFLARRRSAGCKAPDPIFVLGMPRAGSTLIEQILSSHSMIEGTMELPDVINLAKRLGSQAKSDRKSSAYPQLLMELTDAELKSLGDEYLQSTRIQRKTAKPLFIDKMPNNFIHVGFIRLILPNAKIIDARRHPMACCFSNFKQHFAKGQGFSYGQERIARYYRDYVMLMKHFDEAMPGAIYRVIHERLVENFEAEVRALIDFIGVPFEDACLKFYETDRPVRTASSEQVRRPIFTEGLDYWRNYEPWLSPMKEALGDILDAYPGVP